jgi:hypothetical protein
MSGPRVLDESEVWKWLQGQKAAAERIRAERARFLFHLTPEGSCSLYLALWQYGTVIGEGPSPLPTAMRRCLKRWQEKQAGRERS